MQERVAKISAARRRGRLQIPHSIPSESVFCAEEAKALGYKPRFSIFDSADCAGIIGDLAKTIDKGSLRRLQSLISHWKNTGVAPEAALHQATKRNETLAARTYLSAEATLKAYQAVDFDDPHRLPVTLLEAIRISARSGKTVCATCWSMNTRIPMPASTRY